MHNPITIKELLEVKEGEQFQFKEAKKRFDANEAVRCCCVLANCGGGRLVFGFHLSEFTDIVPHGSAE